MTWWAVAAAVVGAVLVAWAALVVALLALKPDTATLRDGVRLLPDVVRLVRRLAGDRSLDRRVRRRLWLLVAYLAMPFDLVPDFVPVLGWADDVVIVVAVLRSVVRRAGDDAVRRHWPGTDDGLAVVLRLVGSAR